jgi:hypothetical protein
LKKKLYFFLADSTRIRQSIHERSLALREKNIFPFFLIEFLITPFSLTVNKYPTKNSKESPSYDTSRKAESEEQAHLQGSQ